MLIAEALSPKQICLLCAATSWLRSSLNGVCLDLLSCSHRFTADEVVSLFGERRDVFRFPVSGLEILATARPLVESEAARCLQRTRRADEPCWQWWHVHKAVGDKLKRAKFHGITDGWLVPMSLLPNQLVSVDISGCSQVLALLTSASAARLPLSCRSHS